MEPGAAATSGSSTSLWTAIPMCRKVWHHSPGETVNVAADLKTILAKWQKLLGGSGSAFRTPRSLETTARASWETRSLPRRVESGEFTRGSVLWRGFSGECSCSKGCPGSRQACHFRSSGWKSFCLLGVLTVRIREDRVASFLRMP